jgi:hypothetical protein
LEIIIIKMKELKNIKDLTILLLIKIRIRRKSIGAIIIMILIMYSIISNNNTFNSQFILLKRQAVITISMKKK